MARSLHTIFTVKHPSSPHLPLSRGHFSNTPKFIFAIPPPISGTRLPNPRYSTSPRRLLAATKISASQDQINGDSSSDFDSFLSALEFISLASSAAVCVYVALRCGVQKAGALGVLGDRVLVWQCVVLVIGLAAGSAVRRRQWRRICGVRFPRGQDSSGANLLEMVERLEEDLRSSTTVIQALSRQLEKLGIRFRLTRKSLKEPIAETAMLVQKNSEATQVLVAQEDVLEKELGEIQNVLLAVQEQQQKQLELILAIGKAGKLWEINSVKSHDIKASKASKLPVPNLETKTLTLQEEGNNDSKMEGLEKLEQVQRTIQLLHSVGVSDANPDAERFLADFTFFMMQRFGELDTAFKFQLISTHISQISELPVGDALQCQGEGWKQIGNSLQLHCDDQTNLDPVPSFHDDVAMIGIDAVIRSNSTLEDFCRSYFMFHKMEVNEPQSIFRYLPMLSFTESYIYQLDGLNEKLLLLPSDGFPTPIMDFEDEEPNLCANSVTMYKKDPFKPLRNLLECRELLTQRIAEELKYGEEYWSLERKLCRALVRNEEISIEDVERAIHLKSFDYRVLNLLLCQLRGEKVNDLHMEFLSISELLVEVSDDLFDYKDDVVENNFNVLRMFVKYYGASTAPIMMAKFISGAEEKYDQVFKALDPELSEKYRKRCEEVTKEGGNTCGGPSLGTWHIPPVIEDEPGYRTTFTSKTP